MQFYLVTSIFFFIGIYTCDAQNLDLELFATNLNRPVSIKHAGSDQLFVAEQTGYIKVINNDGSVELNPFLDIDDRVFDLTATSDERGLLGLAFHPNYNTNGYFYVNYIANNGDTVISRFTRSSANPLLADPNSESIILSFAQPFPNHNGGDLAFGSDGYLYISTGDGGSSGDPQSNAQNTLNFLGKILRINVDSTTSTQNYVIPDTNPFIGNANYKEEIWAYGLRNPWKFSFDQLNGDLWIADVGQGDYEEINLASPSEASVGLNYGWRCYEANAPYNSSNCADISTYTFPVQNYNHFSDGEFKCSITGGYRYRGSNYPGFYGWYFFADLCSEEIGYLIYDDINMSWTKTFVQFSGQWSAFGEAVDGELFISDIATGNIYKLIDTSLEINEIDISNITIYPNPTTHVININFGSRVNLEQTPIISIYDIQGKLVETIYSGTDMVQQINLSNLAKGIYILKLGEQRIHKLVIH